MLPWPNQIQIRQHVQGKIWEFLLQRCPQSHEVPYGKLVDIVKRLEEGLFRSATTQEEYMNLATLEQRLHVLTKPPSINNHNQQLSNTSPPIGTLIPTRGFQQTGTDHLDESQVSNAYLFSEMQNQFQHISLEEHSGAQNDFAGLSDSIEPDAALNQGVRDEFHQRKTGQDVAQPNNLSSDESVMGQCDTSQSAEGRRVKQYKNQQLWLLFLRHARRCAAPKGECPDSNCVTVQELLKHVVDCNVFECTYPRCRSTRVLVNHHKRCRDESCPVCIPVKNFVQAQLKQLVQLQTVAH